MEFGYCGQFDRDEKMIAEWVEEELDTIDLGDERLNVRAKRVLTTLSAAPASSIPAAVGGGRAETEATYRLFENHRFGFDELIEPHIESTLQRIGQESVCVFLQDTTEGDVTRPNQQVVGTGPLDAGARRGCLIHPIYAFTENGIPLGPVAVQIWTREEKEEPKTDLGDEPKKTKQEKEKDRKKLKARPIEQKESYRWVEGVNTAHEVAALYPETHIIIVSDSESDVFEVLSAGQIYTGNSLENDADAEPHADWIIRACQDRVVVLPEAQKSEAEISQSPDSAVSHFVYAQVESAPVMETYTVHVRGRQTKVSCEERERRQPRESRMATVQVRACKIKLKCPQDRSKILSDVEVNAVLVREVNPPAGDVAIEWLLLTSLPITTTEEVLYVIQTYCLRWQIEIFFRVLKQGCRIEERLFETLPRLKRYLAIAFIISWRTLLLSRLGRETPDVSCEAIFEACEWKAVYQVTQKKLPPEIPPTLGEIVRMVAQLGGYVNRTKGAYPGPETIWKGILRMNDLATAWNSFGPGQNE
jgi:hypothetical protein